MRGYSPPHIKNKIFNYKKMRYVDLQCHTTASDGKLTPSELVNLAVEKWLSAIAITDHDTINGISEALSAASGKNIEVIPGVEISCDDEGFVDTHILGLFIDYKNKNLDDLLGKAKLCREEQKISIIKKFKNMGFKISYEEVRSIAKGEIGRPHIANVILKNNSDRVNSIGEIFDRYLAVGKKAYVERKHKIGVREAVNAIHSANGMVFAAHPGVYSNFNPEKFIDFFIENGGDGIETYYAYECSRQKITVNERNALIKKFREIAKRFNLLETGGSDFHGKDGQILGQLKVPYSVLEKLRKSL